jgi:hypothetical protein
MNLYPVHGHIGFKMFFAFCAFMGAQHSFAHLEARIQMNNTLKRIADKLEK